MQRAILNLIAFYREDRELFNNLVVPSGVDKSDLVNRILVEIGELETVFTNPIILKESLGFWSRSRLPIWEKIYNMTLYEYNPIWNVDGETWHEGTSESHSTGTSSGSEEEHQNDTENWSDNKTENKTYSRDRTQTDSFTGSENESGETTNYLSADNSSSWSSDTKQDYTSGKSITNSDIINEDIADVEQITGTGTKTGTKTGTGTRETSGTTKDDQTGSDNWHELRQGNIGVTMTQQLLEAEKKLWENFDFYGYVIEEIKQQFCVLVW